MKKIIKIFIICVILMILKSCSIQKTINDETDYCKDIPPDSCGLFQSEFE